MGYKQKNGIWVPVTESAPDVFSTQFLGKDAPPATVEVGADWGRNLDFSALELRAAAAYAEPGPLDRRWLDMLKDTAFATISGTGRPAPLAALVYEFADKRWAAEVYRETDPLDGTPQFVVYIESGGHRGAGTSFTTGKAVAKFLREQAERKFKGYTPTVDTLSCLIDRAAGSVVPECYHPLPNESEEGTGCSRVECPECAWRSRCGLGVPPKAETVQNPQSEEDRLKKLRDLVAERWGKDDSEGEG